MGLGEKVTGSVGTHELPVEWSKGSWESVAKRTAAMFHCIKYYTYQKLQGESSVKQSVQSPISTTEAFGWNAPP
jgi:hypothetical protein